MQTPPAPRTRSVTEFQDSGFGFVSRFVSTRSESHIFARIVSRLTGAGSPLKPETFSHKKTQMRLDTYEFVISRSPVQSRRVAPFFQQHSFSASSLLSHLSRVCQQIVRFRGFRQNQRVEAHQQNQLLTRAHFGHRLPFAASTPTLIGGRSQPGSRIPGIDILGVPRLEVSFVRHFVSKSRDVSGCCGISQSRHSKYRPSKPGL